MIARMLVVALIGMSGCSTLDTVTRQDYRQTVAVTWVRSSEKCANGKVACAEASDAGCVVRARRPQHFGDTLGMAALGEELWHCFGAEGSGH